MIIFMKIICTFEFQADFTSKFNKQKYIILFTKWEIARITHFEYERKLHNFKMTLQMQIFFHASYFWRLSKSWVLVILSSFFISYNRRDLSNPLRTSNGGTQIVFLKIEYLSLCIFVVCYKNINNHLIYLSNSISSAFQNATKISILKKMKERKKEETFLETLIHPLKNQR